MWSVTSTGIVTYIYTQDDVTREARILAAKILLEQKITIVSDSKQN